MRFRLSGPKPSARAWGYIAAFAVFAALAGTTMFAASAPGSAEDPLVSKSYVDGKLAAVNADAVAAEVVSRLGPLLSARGGYVPVFLNAHGLLVGGEGCEIILRSGPASAVAPGADGLPDLTSAHELTDGAWLTKNHLVIIPRADGRGVRAGADGAWLLVKGGYSVE